MKLWIAHIEFDIPVAAETEAEAQQIASHNFRDASTGVYANDFWIRKGTFIPDCYESDEEPYYSRNVPDADRKTIAELLDQANDSTFASAENSTAIPSAAAS